MMEFVGLVPFLGESNYGLPWKPCVLTLPKQIYFRTTLSRIYGVLINNLAPIRNCPRCNVT